MVEEIWREKERERELRPELPPIFVIILNSSSNPLLIAVIYISFPRGALNQIHPRRRPHHRGGDGGGSTLVERRVRLGACFAPTCTDINTHARTHARTHTHAHTRARTHTSLSALCTKPTQHFGRLYLVTRSSPDHGGGYWCHRPSMDDALPTSAREEK